MARAPPAMVACPARTVPPDDGVTGSVWIFPPVRFPVLHFCYMHLAPSLSFSLSILLATDRQICEVVKQLAKEATTVVEHSARPHFLRVLTTIPRSRLAAAAVANEAPAADPCEKADRLVNGIQRCKSQIQKFFSCMQI